MLLCSSGLWRYDYADVHIHVGVCVGVCAYVDSNYSEEPWTSLCNFPDTMFHKVAVHMS